jgi:hypothetical protein
MSTHHCWVLRMHLALTHRLLSYRHMQPCPEVCRVRTGLLNLLDELARHADAKTRLLSTDDKIRICVENNRIIEDFEALMYATIAAAQMANRHPAGDQ